MSFQLYSRRYFDMKSFVSSAQCIYVFPVIISNEMLFVIEK